MTGGYFRVVNNRVAIGRQWLNEATATGSAASAYELFINSLSTWLNKKFNE